MKRWHEETLLMLHRKRLVADESLHWERVLGYVVPRDNDLGRWRKRHPNDCGKSQCGCCHWEKHHEPKRRGAVRRRAIAQGETA